MEFGDCGKVGTLYLALPYRLVMAANFSRTSGENSPGKSRHFQLPPVVDGVFILAVLSYPKMSCIGMTQSFATLRIAPQMSGRYMF